MQVIKITDATSVAPRLLVLASKWSLSSNLSKHKTISICTKTFDSITEGEKLMRVECFTSNLKRFDWVREKTKWRLTKCWHLTLVFYIKKQTICNIYLTMCMRLEKLSAKRLQMNKLLETRSDAFFGFLCWRWLVILAIERYWFCWKIQFWRFSEDTKFSRSTSSVWKVNKNTILPPRNSFFSKIGQPVAFCLQFWKQQSVFCGNVQLFNQSRRFGKFCVYRKSALNFQKPFGWIKQQQTKNFSSHRCLRLRALRIAILRTYQLNVPNLNTVLNEINNVFENIRNLLEKRSQETFWLHSA